MSLAATRVRLVKSGEVGENNQSWLKHGFKHGKHDLAFRALHGGLNMGNMTWSQHVAGAPLPSTCRYLPITKVLLATSWPGAKYLKQTCMQKGVDAKQCRQLKVQPDLGRAIGHALLYIDFLTVREALPRIPDCSN